MISEREVLHYISACGSCVGGSEAYLPVKETSYENNRASALGDLHNSLSISDCNATGIEKSMDRINEYPKGNLGIMTNLADSLPRRALTAPIVVHVSRTKEVENKRQDLLIVMMEQEIMEAINDNISVINAGRQVVSRPHKFLSSL